MKRFLSLVIIFVFALSALCSCAGQTEIRVKLVVEAGEDRILSQRISITDAMNDGISVIEVVNEAAANFPTFDVTLNEGATSVKDVGVYKTGTYQGHNVYWTYTINGEEPQKGKASDNLVKDGDTIRYCLVVVDAIEGSEDTNTYEYTSDMNFFGEEETEPVEDTEEVTETEAE